MPQMKDLVPSIGSSTQTYSASARSAPNSSPMTPCSGKVRLISVRMAASAARSAAVTGSKPPGAALIFEPEADRAQRAAEERPDGFAGNGGEFVDECREIDCRHVAPRCHLDTDDRVSKLDEDGNRAVARLLRRVANSLCNIGVAVRRQFMVHWLEFKQCLGIAKYLIYSAFVTDNCAAKHAPGDACSICGK